MGFYGSNNPTNSVKALKEDVQELGFNPTRPTLPNYSSTTHMQYDKINTKKNTNTNESRHSELGPVRQNPIHRTVRTAHLSVLMTVHNFQYTIQHRTVLILPLFPPDKHHTQMLCIGGEGAAMCKQPARSRCVQNEQPRYSSNLPPDREFDARTIFNHDATLHFS